jgi:hypothetical protein
MVWYAVRSPEINMVRIQTGSFAATLSDESVAPTAWPAAGSRA